MRFVLRMLAREVRASWARLVFFFVGVAVGVAAMVAVRSLVDAVRGELGTRARELLAADVLIQTNRPWDAATRAALERHLGAAEARTETVSTSTMARPADREGAARLVELRGLAPGFPFYGEVRLSGGRRYDHALVAGHGALVAPELLAQLGLRVGDGLLLGGERYTIRGVVLAEPGRRPSVFSLGPRVLVDRADLLASGLLGFGSRSLHQVLLKLPEPAIEPMLKALRAEFREQYVSVHSHRGAEGQAGEGLARAEGFLGLTAFAVMALGGVGVFSVMRVFVQEKLRTIAVLKCLGASGRSVLVLYAGQVLLLGLAGGLAGVAAAGAGLALVPEELVQALGATRPALSARAVLLGVATGLLVSFLFSILPLLDVHRVKPLLLLRHERPASSGRDRGRQLAALASALGLAALAAAQAGSPRAGLIAAAGFALLLALLHVAGGLLMRGAARLAGGAGFPLRHAVMRVARPGNHTRPVLLAVGLGSFFILAVADLRQQLLAQMQVALAADAPDLFLLDVQPDQAGPLRAFLAGRSAEPPRLLPVVRARVTGVSGRTVRLEDFQDVRGRGSLAREYVVSWRAALERNERVVAGRFWDAGADPAEPEVSIEESLRRRFGIDVGDSVRFDILGRVVSARVTSVRAVDWADARSGAFMFLFRPGALRGVPETYLGFVRGPEGAPERGALAAALSAAFPNVSVLDLRDLLAGVRGLLAGVALAISAVGGLTLVCGSLILLGSVAVTRYERRYEAAILRTLGARPRAVAAWLATEYALLGGLAGLIGALGSLGLTAALTRLVLDVPWSPDPRLALGGIAACVLGVALVGVAANLDLLRRKPLSVLRAE